MKSNKILASAILATFFVVDGGAAHADIDVLNTAHSNIEVYGILDIAYGTVQHSLGINSQYSQSINPVSPTAIARSTATSAAPAAVSGLFNGGLQDPRLGLKGGWDLGNGLNAFFTLEEGINLTTLQANNSADALASNGKNTTTAATGGSLDGQLFNRQAFVGLADDKLGSVAVGRNYAPIYDVASSYDPVQFSQLFSPLGFSGTYGGGGGVSEDARLQSSLKYTNKIGSVNFGAITELNGSAGDSTAKSGYGLNIGYVEGDFAIQAAYQSFVDALKGGVSTTTADTVTVSAYNTSSFIVAAKYKFNDAFKAKIGFETYTLSAPSDIIALATTSYYGQTVSKVTTNSTIAPQATNIIFFGGDYNFTDKLNVAAGIYDISLQQSSDYVPTSASNPIAKTGQASGDQRYYSVLADYHFTKALDTYAGAMYSTYSGNANPAATYYQSNNIAAVGVRFAF
jgi:GBP family porin